MEETDVSVGQGSPNTPQTARQIVVTSPFFHTPGGVSTRSKPAELWREYPTLRFEEAGKDSKGASLELYDAPEKGIAFLIEPGVHKDAEVWGECRAVIVHTQGDEATFVTLGKVTN